MRNCFVYGWTVRDSNPGTSKKFPLPQKCLPNLLFDWYRGFVGLKRLAREVEPSPPASAKVKNHLNLSSLYMLSWNERDNFTFTFPCIYLVYMQLELHNIFHYDLKH
jgi:hypothetical protein